MIDGLKSILLIIWLTSSDIKFILSILFSFLFSLASFIAFLFISIPNTLFAFSLTYIPIVPVPQYKSNILSSLLELAYSFIFSYILYVTLSLTWKNESNDTLYLYLPISFIIYASLSSTLFSLHLNIILSFLFSIVFIYSFKLSFNSKQCSIFIKLLLFLL